MIEDISGLGALNLRLLGFVARMDINTENLETPMSGPFCPHSTWEGSTETSRLVRVEVIDLGISITAHH